jgi:hypothetical protein
VVPADSVTHLSEKLIQILAEGAQVPPGGVSLSVAVRRLLAAVVGVDDEP